MTMFPLIVQPEAPATGATVTVLGGREVFVALSPAGTIAALTITLASSPTNGDRVTITSTKIVTLVTMDGGTIVGALTTLALGGFGAFVFNGDTSTWSRCG